MTKSGKNVTINLNIGQDRVLCKSCFHIHSWQKLLSLKDYNTDRSDFDVPRLSPTVSITVEEAKEDSSGSLYIDDDNGNSGNGDGLDDLPPYSYDRSPIDLTPQEIDLQLTVEEWEEEVNNKQKEADTELELYLDSEMKENGAKGAAEEARSNAANKPTVSSTAVVKVAEEQYILAQQSRQYRKDKLHKAQKAEEEVKKKTISRILQRINELAAHMAELNIKETDGLERIDRLTAEVNEKTATLNQMENDIAKLKT